MSEKREKKEIVISENRDFKGIWIPEKLYLTRQFTPNEKFLLLEIYSLTNKKNRECFANNKHFADFVGLKENTVQKMMLKFENSGYIKRNYEYRGNTKEIERRTIKIMQKFYDDFINEKSDADSSPEDIENNPEGNGIKSTSPVEKNPQGDGLKAGDKYNSFKSNNNLSITNLSDTEKAEASKQDFEDGAEAFSIKKKPVPHVPKKKTKSELKQLEQNMIKRFSEIASEYNVTDTCRKNIVNAFQHYLYRYTQKTGKIHPILTSGTLVDIFETLAVVGDSEYHHFGNVAEIEPDENGVGYLEKIVDAYFDSEHRNDTDWHISHFVAIDYLEKTAQHIIEY